MRRQFFSEDVEIPFEALDTKWRETSIFGEDVIALNDRWTASLGLRYDKIRLDEMFSEYWQLVSQFNTAFNPHQDPDPIKGHYSPRIATAYALDKDTTIKASYQHGFRITDAAGTFPGKQTDIGSFLNEPGIIRNLGGEIGVTFQPVSNIEIRPSYGYVTSNAEMRYPTHQIKLNTLSYFWNNKFLFALDYLYNSRYSKSDLQNANVTYRRNRHVVDAALKYNITPDLQIGVTGNNIFENDVPPMVFEPDRVDKGGLGYDEMRVYLTLTLKM